MPSLSNGHDVGLLLYRQYPEVAGSSPAGGIGYLFFSKWRSPAARSVVLSIPCPQDVPSTILHQPTRTSLRLKYVVFEQHVEEGGWRNVLCEADAISIFFQQNADVTMLTLER